MSDGGSAEQPTAAVAAGRGELPKAIVVEGAGSEEANGLYKATAREYCNAPVYEHFERGAELKITREPHKNPKTGVVKHGWLLGLKKTPLYGAPTEALAVPAAGWKKFNGEPPVPTVSVFSQVAEYFFSMADASKAAGDAAVQAEDWPAATAAFTRGLEALKRSGERFGDAFTSRSSQLLARRAIASMKLQPEPAARDALRDAVAALELARGLNSAETVAIEAARALGCPDDQLARKLLEPLGLGRILDPGAPLVLRCVERWLEDSLDALREQGDAATLPEVKHMPADRYLDGLSEEQRKAIIERYLPEENAMELGGTAVLQNARECLNLMKEWEKVFNGEEFQQKRKALWDVELASYTLRLQVHRKMVADALAPVLVPMGFVEGTRGLTRCIKQMQHYWSIDKACAKKALDLEELCDISLADLDST